MIPSSDQLETFLERLTNLDRDLAKIKGAEVTKSGTINEIKAISKDWLRFSEALRSVEALPQECLNAVDTQIKGLLHGTNARTRSSAYQKKLAPVLSSFMDQIVIPVIRFGGSPSRVASRQLMAEFDGRVSPDEQAYLEEAARCLASGCNRAAIILLWATAIARLHGAIEKIGFNALNTGFDLVNQKKGNPFSRVTKTCITSLPELQRCRDFDLLVVGMELWKYDLQVFEELDRLLGIRNSAAHPGMFGPSALDVQQYASKIRKYVCDTVRL